MKTLIFCCLLLPVLVAGQDIDRPKLDSLFEAIEKKDQGMGSFAISKDGTLLYQRALGYQNVEQEERATAATRYGIGSISKVFTAVLTLKLAEEGKLTLDTKLSEYFEGLPDADKITIEQLLRHRSGLHNFTDDEDYIAIMETPMSRTALLSHFAKKENDFDPGEQMSYSNTGYVVLSYLLEEAAGQSYSELLNQYITEPCGLEDTYLPEKVVGTQEEEAHSYTKSDTGWSEATLTHPSIPVGAGAIISTPADLTAFMDCLFSGQLIGTAYLEQMTTMVDRYGLGLVQFPFQDKFAYGHSGGIDGFSSMAAHFPEQDISVAYISNGTVFPVNNIMIGALSIVFEMPYEIPAFAPAIEVPVSELEEYVGTYGSDSFPLDIEVFVEEGALKAQGTGQPAITLEPFDKHQFRFEPAGIKVEFVPGQNKLILKQGGVYELIKQ